MTQPLLSILIPNTTDREEMIKPLIGELSRQTGIINYWLNESKWQINEGKNDLVQIVVFTDDKSLTIGEKRELMYKMAIGKYSWQIDSDDSIAPSAIQLILEAIKSNPEIPVITFRESCMMDGVYKSSNHSIKYEKWCDNFDGYDYCRSPFYKDVIRTDIAKQVPFEKIRWNEDERQSYALKPFLTDEIHIDQELYLYIHNSTPSHERYGFDKD